MSLLELFCHVHDFCVRYAPQQQARLLPDGEAHRNRRRSLGLSEVMTILIAFYRSGCRTFKDFYCKYVRILWQAEFLA